MPPISCRSIENCGSRRQDREQGAELDHQRGELAAARLLLRGRVLVDVLLVDVAGPQVRRGDRHDRGRHECADADGREGDAGEPAREHLVEQQRHDRVAVGLARGVRDRRDAGLDRHVAQQREQAEDEAVGRQRGHVALDDVAVARGEHGGHRVRVEEQRQRRAERERRVLQLRRAGEDHAVARVRRRGELLLRGAEDLVPAAELVGDHDDGDDDHEVDQRVLDERDQRRCAQARSCRCRPRGSRTPR